MAVTRFDLSYACSIIEIREERIAILFVTHPSNGAKDGAPTSGYSKPVKAMFRKAGPPAGKSSPLWTFFNPALISGEGDQNYLPSVIFHEGLHGFTTVPDGLPPALGRPGLCQILKIDQAYPNCWSETQDVTFWIENIVFPLN